MFNQRRIKEIEDKLNSVISSIRSEVDVEIWTSLTEDHVYFTEVLDVEVAPISYPASTLFFNTATQNDYATGGVTENEWRWIQRSYFDNSDPRPAQEEYKVLFPDLLEAFRKVQHFTLPDGTVAEINVSDTGPAQPATAPGMPPVLVKSLEIVVRTEED